MHFRLKNAGATYQQLMDQIFKHQFNRNVEVYVDDILIKSAQARQLVADITEKFSTLRKYDLKLNPSKYLFGVNGGCFLGYVVTERGIEANLEKVKALQKMMSPINTTEISKVNYDPIPIYLSLDREEFAFFQSSALSYSIFLG